MIEILLLAVVMLLAFLLFVALCLIGDRAVWAPAYRGYGDLDASSLVAVAVFGLIAGGGVTAWLPTSLLMIFFVSGVTSCRLERGTR